MKVRIIILLASLLVACQSSEKYMDFFDHLDPLDDIEGYQLRLGYSAMVMSGVADYESGMSIVRNLIEIHSFPEARYCIDHLTDVYGASGECYFQKAVSYRNEYQYELAFESIEKAISLDNTLDKYHKEARIIEEEGEVWSQIESINLQFNDGKNTELFNKRAELLISVREFIPAINDLDRALELDSLNSNSYYLKGMARLHIPDYSGASELFQHLLLLDISESERILYENFSRASKNLEAQFKAINADPQEVINYINMSRQLSMIGENDRALALIETGLSFNTNDLRLLQGRLLIHIQMGEMEKARQGALYIESLGLSLDPQLRRLLQ